MAVEIGTANPRRGNKATGTIPVGDFPDGSPVDLPVIVMNGSKPGPRLWLNAGLHGEENIGAVVILRTMQQLDPKKLNGVVIATPAANITGFQRRERCSPIDKINMDGMQWPGNPNGKFSEQLANIISQKIINNTNYVIDIHNGMPGLMRVCNWIIYNKEGKANKEFAQSFGYKYMVGYAGGNPSVGFHAFLDQRGIPSFYAEVDSQDENHIDEACQGIINTMIYLKMIDGVPKLPEKCVALPKYTKIYAKRGGIWHPKVKLEECISKGQSLAIVSDIFGEEKERIISPVDGIVLSIWVNSIIGTGEDMAFEIGMFEEP